MEEKEEVKLPTTLNVIEEGNKIVEKIMSEEDPNELDKLTQLFNVNQKKREIARVNKLSNLLNSIDNKVEERITQYGDIIEDKDLINYWKVTQENVSNRTDEDNQLPKITINNTQNINVNSSGLNRESRAKVLDIVSKILGDAKTDVVDIEQVRKEDK